MKRFVTAVISVSVLIPSIVLAQSFLQPQNTTAPSTNITAPSTNVTAPSGNTSVSGNVTVPTAMATTPTVSTLPTITTSPVCPALTVNMSRGSTDAMTSGQVTRLQRYLGIIPNGL